MRTAITILILFCVILLSGCQESQQKVVWGQGEPPADWQGWFGNSNIARLDFVQTQRIEIQGKVIEDLIKLNAEQHKKMGEVDIALSERVKELEVFLGGPIEDSAN